MSLAPDMYQGMWCRLQEYLDLKDGFVKECHEVPDDAQHFGRVCGVIALPKVLSHLLHLLAHLPLKLLYTEKGTRTVSSFQYGKY